MLDVALAMPKQYRRPIVVEPALGVVVGLSLSPPLLVAPTTGLLTDYGVARPAARCL